MNEKKPHDHQKDIKPDAKGRTKKLYRSPQLKEWGTVSDLTGTGNTHPGGDLKGGSVLSPGA